MTKYPRLSRAVTGSAPLAYTRAALLSRLTVHGHASRFSAPTSAGRGAVAAPPSSTLAAVAAATATPNAAQASLQSGAWRAASVGVGWRRLGVGCRQLRSVGIGW